MRFTTIMQSMIGPIERGNAGAERNIYCACAMIIIMYVYSKDKFAVGAIRNGVVDCSDKIATTVMKRCNTSSDYRATTVMLQLQRRQ